MAVTRSKLSKIARDFYRLEPHKPPTRSLRRVNFLHICFDETEERLFVIDAKGVGYLLELIFNSWNYRNVGFIGQSTFVAFNPIEKSEVIVGLASSDVQIIKLNNNATGHFCSLQGHQLPPISVSFYKNYCLTASPKEAIVWDLKSCMKIHQLQLENDKCRIKKAAFSSAGLVVALYENDTIQAWRFEQFDFDMKVCLCDHKLRNVKDFTFTKNGRALIVCGAKRKIIVLDTRSWILLKSIELPEKSSVARRLAIVPISLDAGANKMISILFEDGKVMFLDLNGGTYVETSDHILTGIRKVIISPHGQWTASIQFDGSLIVSGIDRLINITPDKTKMKIKSVAPRPKAHRSEQHLKYIDRNMKEAMELSRLVPILKEFGEYPERHRGIIWRTIMELPGNRKASAGLNNKIPVEATAKLLNHFKLADKTKAALLTLTVERLVQLFPMLEQCQFLPELIFPFITVFQKDPLSAFEAILMILWNYCQKWFEYHPFPPLNILGIIENILMEVEPSLLKFYYDHDVTSTYYAWPLLKTTMSEVLSGNEWLILWDHLLTHRKPWLLLLCVVAYNICSKDVLTTLMSSKEDIEKYLGQQGQVSLKEILKVANRLDDELSEKNHPAQYFRKEFCILPSDGPYPPFLMAEYPKFVIENQAKLAQLDKLKEEEADLIEKRRQSAIKAEEKRLQEESDNFAKQIHQQRLEELQKCCNEQLRITEMGLSNERGKHPEKASTSRSAEIMSPCGKTCVRSKSQTRTNSCRKLRNDVQDLVGEVQTFLKSMRSRR